MKVAKLLIATTFLLLVSFITCQEKRAILVNNIINSVNQTKPKGLENLISSFETKMRILFYSVTLKELNEMQKQWSINT